MEAAMSWLGEAFCRLLVFNCLNTNRLKMTDCFPIPLYFEVRLDAGLYTNAQASGPCLISPMMPMKDNAMSDGDV
jgi:hypothetical protein